MAPGNQGRYSVLGAPTSSSDMRCTARSSTRRRPAHGNIVARLQPPARSPGERGLTRWRSGRGGATHRHCALACSPAHPISAMNSSQICADLSSETPAVLQGTETLTILPGCLAFMLLTAGNGAEYDRCVLYLGLVPRGGDAQDRGLWGSIHWDAFSVRASNTSPRTGRDLAAEEVAVGRIRVGRWSRSVCTVPIAVGPGELRTATR